MANENIILTELEPAVGFTCADNTGIEKGTHLKLTDPMTVIITSGAANMFAGIAAEEKVANDGKTKIGVYMRGIFRGTAGGSITAGDIIQSETGGTNEFLTAAASTDNAGGCGIALEDATDGQTFKYLLNVGIGGSIET
ncbi:hypothetical protein LCGC14_0956390 [marine sediment metagenome]|uniref:Uncharacterized protein n=1 Tax=marine sediment metagenome TaxID=412755 RepID=A0A0F9RM92_9ZZZZ